MNPRQAVPTGPTILPCPRIQPKASNPGVGPSSVSKNPTIIGSPPPVPTAVLILCSSGESGGKTPSGSAPARTRAKPKISAAHTFCSIGTEQADEAVILEGVPQEIEERAVWKRFAAVYNKKYGGDVEPMLTASGGNVYRVEPETAFGQDEHSPNFAESVTRWRFSKSPKQ